MLDCGNCGLQFEPRGADGLYYEDDEYTCKDCGTVNRIGIDDETAYVSRWRCRHDTDEDSVCLCCDAIEDLNASLAGLWSLWHCLAVAGALCAAFGDGWARGLRCMDWEPGRGRPR